MFRFSRHPTVTLEFLPKKNPDAAVPDFKNYTGPQAKASPGGFEPPLPP